MILPQNLRSWLKKTSTANVHFLLQRLDFYTECTVRMDDNYTVTRKRGTGLSNEQACQMILARFRISFTIA